MVAWVPQLAGDSRDAVQPFAGATQYWDGEHKLAAEAGHALGADGWNAWDVYLYYPPSQRWDDRLPAPMAAIAQTQGVVVATKGLLPPVGEQTNRLGDVVGSQDDLAAIMARATDSFARQCGCAMTTSSPSAPAPGATSK